MVRAKAVRPRDTRWEQPLWVDDEVLEPFLDRQRRGTCSYGECLQPPRRRCRFEGDEQALKSSKTYKSQPKMVRDEFLKAVESACSPHLEACRGMKVRPEDLQVAPQAKPEEQTAGLKPIPLPKNSFFEDLIPMPVLFHTTSVRKKYSKAEDEVIIKGRLRDNPLSWDAIAALLPGRTGNMIKKRWGNRLAAKAKRQTGINKVRRSAAMAAIENFAEEEEESSEEEEAPPPPTSRPVASTKTVDRNNYFNQIVTVSGQIDESGKPSLFYVLVWHVEEGTCDLVRVKQDGCFSVRSSRLGKPRYKLVPEGQGEEMTRIPVSRIRVVHNEAVYKLSDADKEAWNLLEEPRLPSPPPETLGDTDVPAISGEPVQAGAVS